MAAPGIITQQEIDEVLIRYADTLSPAAISFKIEGLLSPEQVMVRTNQLLETPDRFTALQQDQLVTQKMRHLVVQLEEMMTNPHTMTARTAEVLGAQLERLGNRLDRRAASTEKELHTLYAFQGGVLLDGVMASMNYMRTQIAAGNVPKNEEDWQTMLQTSIRYAQFEIASHEEGAELRVSRNQPDDQLQEQEDENPEAGLTSVAQKAISPMTSVAPKQEMKA